MQWRNMGGMPSCYITQSPLGAGELGVVKVIYMSLELLLDLVHTLLFLSLGARSH